MSEDTLLTVEKNFAEYATELQQLSKRVDGEGELVQADPELRVAYRALGLAIRDAASVAADVSGDLAPR